MTSIAVCILLAGIMIAVAIVAAAFMIARTIWSKEDIDIARATHSGRLHG